MKKIITSAALILLITLYLPACKKTDKKQTTLEKIQGKWIFDNDVANEHISGEDNIITITGVAGDNIDFRADGKIYTSIQGEADTSTYSLSGDTKLIVDGNQGYDITALTSNSFILHQKVNASGSDFYEETLTLKK